MVSEGEGIVRTTRLVASILLAGLLAGAPTLAVPLPSVSDGGIYFSDPDSNGVGAFLVQPEMISTGSNLWPLNNQWDQATAAMEFDLTGLATGTHTLQLLDTAGGGSGHLYDLFGYVGDGVVTVTDRFNTTNLLTTFPTSSASVSPVTPAYFLDVSTFINQRIGAGDTYAGFHIVAANATSFEAFGATAWLESTASVPEPTVVALLAPLLVGLALRSRTRARD